MLFRSWHVHNSSFSGSAKSPTRFGEGCKFDHPPEYAVQLNRNGLPVRPGEPIWYGSLSVHALLSVIVSLGVRSAAVCLCTRGRHIVCMYVCFL
jgi:hypothetical protein